MVFRNADSSLNLKFRWAALLTGLFVGLTGLFPHLRWSLEMNQWTWFFNSYDEGYYAWGSISEFTVNRALSYLIMHLLYWLSGGNSQTTMVVADFLFPLGVTLAVCYLVRPLFTRPSGMMAGAFFILVSAECGALRSTAIPHSGFYNYLRSEVTVGNTWLADIIQIGNPTLTFWIFRTPEPQISCILMFFALGLAMRLILSKPPHSKRKVLLLAVSSLITGMGYLFCALTLGGSLTLAAFITAKSDQRTSRILGASGILCLTACIGFSLYAAGQIGGSSFIFASHQPVVMISIILGFLAVAAILLRHWKRLQPLHLFAIALGLTPLFIANQQLVTGHMIYLLNFENFGLAQFTALALLISILPSPAKISLPSGYTDSGRSIHWWVPPITILPCLLFGGILLRSQILSYNHYLAENREAWSYAKALNALPASDAYIACDDFFQTDTLALRVGYRPNFLISRDMVFSAPVDRLRHERDVPSNSFRTRNALYHYLALTGTSPEDLNQRFNAITDPEDQNWQDRFMLGGLIYNYADFWDPLTHGRDTKLDWIKAQKDLIVSNYATFLREGTSRTDPVIFIMRKDKPDPETHIYYHSRKLILDLNTLPVPIKVFLIGAPSAPKPANL